MKIRDMMKRKIHLSRTIFPADWVGERPYDRTGEADIYYAGVATRVYNILSRSFVRDEIIHEDRDIRRAAMALTGLFEDIISGTGMWDLLVRECLRRYGKELPFYDMTGYVRGEINLQDVRLLLWDILQSHRQGSMLNPENPYMEEIAGKIFRVFDEEYEFAVENEPLRVFLTHPEIAQGYWRVRHRLEWILQSSFLNHRYMTELPGELEPVLGNDFSDEIGIDKILYHMQVDHMFSFRSNLLSMRSCEILSGICGMDSNGKIAGMRMLPMFHYLYCGHDEEMLRVRRLADDAEFAIAMESFDKLDTSSLKAGVSIIICNLVKYGGEWYQAGIMSMSPDGGLFSEESRMNELQQLNLPFTKEQVKRYKSVMQGKDILFFSTYEKLRSFINEAAGQGPDFDSVKEFPRNTTYMVLLHPSKGLSIVAGLNHCIFIEGNTFYDPERAAIDSLAFYVSPDACPYETACCLQDKGLLPNAAINSLKGTDYGRAFLHDNGRFITDYFFHRYRGDDCL